MKMKKWLVVNIGLFGNTTDRSGSIPNNETVCRHLFLRFTINIEFGFVEILSWNGSMKSEIESNKYFSTSVALLLPVLFLIPSEMLLNNYCGCWFRLPSSYPL